MNFISSLLERLSQSGEKIVIVSERLAVLDAVGEICKDRGYKPFRLDGAASAKDRGPAQTMHIAAPTSTTQVLPNGRHLGVEHKQRHFLAK